MPDINKASRAFQQFTGRKPSKVYSAQLDDAPVKGYRLGSLVGVAYEATRDGKTEQYFHRFKKDARPDLVSKDDGRQLYITRGKYKVTDRGVEDMPKLFVVNPSPRPSLRRKTKRTAPKMARRKTVRRRRAVSTFRANPVRRRRRRAVSVMRANPVRRRRVARRRVVRYRRNPSVRLGGRGFPKITALVLPAIGIGIGAVGSELALGYLPIPAAFKTGTFRHLTKGVVSVALGMLIGKFMNRKAGEAFAMGGLVIAAHDAAKETLVKMLPGARFGQYVTTPQGALGRYVPRTRGGISYYSPAQTVPNVAMGSFESQESTPDFRA